jgi:hypothetical protein
MRHPKLRIEDCDAMDLRQPSAHYSKARLIVGQPWCDAACQCCQSRRSMQRTLTSANSGVLWIREKPL